MLANRTLQAAAGITGNYRIQRSLRFRAAATAYLTRTPGVTSSRQIWTISMWVKRGILGTRYALAGGGNSAPGGGTGWGARFDATTDTFTVFAGGGVTMHMISTKVFRDPSAWYHIVLSVDTTQATAANRFRIYVNNEEITSFSTNTQIPQNTSLDWNNSTTSMYLGVYNDATILSQHLDGYMAEVYNIDGQALTPSSFGQTDTTTGQWVAKRYTGTYGTNGFYLPFSDNSSTTALGYDNSNGTGATVTNYNNTLTTNNTGWQNFGLRAVVTSSATQSQGKWVRVQLLSGTSGCSISGMKFGKKATGGSGADFTGDQVQLTFGGVNSYEMSASSTLTSDWIYYPAGVLPNTDYVIAVAFGATNGSVLSLAPGAANVNSYTKAGDTANALNTTVTGYSSGAGSAYLATYVQTQGANWTPNNISLTGGPTYDSMLDVPAGNGNNSTIAGNYCVLNPNDRGALGGGTADAPTNGNLSWTGNSSGDANIRATVFVSTGKWYWEATNISSAIFIGVAKDTVSMTANSIPAQTGGYGYASNGQMYANGATLGFNATFTTTDIIGFALDMDAGTFSVYKNGVLQSLSWSGLSGNFAPSASDTTLAATSVTFNFGQSNFVYAAPAGYTAISNARQASGNYATLNSNVLDPSSIYTNATNGNLTAVTTKIGQHYAVASGFRVTSGKFYFEILWEQGLGDPNASFIGVRENELGSIPFYSGSGVVGAVTGASGSTFGLGDIIGMAFDVTAKTVEFFKNGVSQGGVRTATGWTSTSTNTYYPFCSVSDGGTRVILHLNFGQRPFTYTPPTGFKALHTGNLTAPTIRKSNQHFDASLYSGTSATQSIVNSGGFQPDFVWTKMRNPNQSHSLYDVVRGVNTLLQTDTTAAEQSITGSLTAFNSNGFTLGSSGQSNLSPYTYIAWQWKAGGTAVTNTAGTITSQVSANPTAGFSVVTFNTTAVSVQTWGHGLGVAPSFIIVRWRDAVDQWYVYHISMGANASIFLNTTGAMNTPSTLWNNTTPSSTIVTFGSGWASAHSLVAYCFAEIPGFSKFGSYTGNGSTDGPFVYTGFRPKYVIIKSNSISGDWWLFDSVRNTFNVIGDYLLANGSGAEANNTATIDFTANGFKLRLATFQPNTSGATFIFAAFAESPFKYANAR